MTTGSSLAGLLRAQRRIREVLDGNVATIEAAGALRWALDVLSEEQEREQERIFTRPINPDPVTAEAQAQRENKGMTEDEEED